VCDLRPSIWSFTGSELRLYNHFVNSAQKSARREVWIRALLLFSRHLHKYLLP
jgi:hypothetical protein